MKTHHIQAAFARKRENQHIRTERTEAVDRYYAHWGKQTSKYENWTAPEYYKQAEENLKKSKERKDKEKSLSERREKLKKLLQDEKIMLEEQLANLQRQKPKSRNISTDIMEKIDQNFKANQDDKRRLDLEAKLYGRLRHGVEDGSFLYESKSNNQVLAKLNWLDKQIDDQVKREQEEKQTLERTLRMQEEIRKTEEYHKQRQEIREKEIREIRALQEKHVAELKEREHEADVLKSEAHNLQTTIDQIDTDLITLETNNNQFLEEVPYSNNLRNMKTIIRKRSEGFRTNLKSDIELLSRVASICPQEPSIKDFIERLNQQLNAEMHNLSQIECMYESEAKVNLQQCEETWRRLSYERRFDLKNVLKELKSQLMSTFYENQMRQKELIDIRTTHLSSIENSNKQLKLLIREDEIPSPRAASVIETPRAIKDKQLEPVHRVGDSFTNLNLDCLSGDGAEVLSQPSTARSQLLDTASDTSQGPKFGRKKIAWT
ncbi:trichoplein keratin filament-binding protein [Eupeodes corollae]|uniref:trichoplein keratin filament-binding protein n=1 Tax=Eupeodes corollae TaxID=290404 RepID=UPI0024904C60|nr:trichoplein keratin filament-binding protein [Eupeodes corollae]XP_055905688.1 trichoplein keratin filament-binding protein [Eupeodes corollae]XP_055905689.1 trichoplein keratin filament-binding protein [Eupeodes corollae]